MNSYTPPKFDRDGLKEVDQPKYTFEGKTLLDLYPSVTELTTVFDALVRDARQGTPHAFYFLEQMVIEGVKARLLG